MKYKIHYKANDEVEDYAFISKFMKKNGYQFNYEYLRQNDPDYCFVMRKKENSTYVYFAICPNNHKIRKYTQSKTSIWIDGVYQKDEKDILFTKEELKFFDLLDFETESIIRHLYLYEDTYEPIQDITDWISM
jgi:hypothetical protein